MHIQKLNKELTKLIAGENIDEYFLNPKSVEEKLKKLFFSSTQINEENKMSIILTDFIYWSIPNAINFKAEQTLIELKKIEPTLNRELDVAESKKDMVIQELNTLEVESENINESINKLRLLINSNEVKISSLINELDVEAQEKKLDLMKEVKSLNFKIFNKEAEIKEIDLKKVKLLEVKKENKNLISNIKKQLRSLSNDIENNLNLRRDLDRISIDNIIADFNQVIALVFNVKIEFQYSNRKDILSYNTIEFDTNAKCESKYFSINPLENNYLLRYFQRHSKCICPKNWRSLLINVLSDSIPDKLFEINRDSVYQEFKGNERLLENSELLYLLSIRNALISKTSSISNVSNKILMPIASGIAVEIMFRESHIQQSLNGQISQILINRLNSSDNPRLTLFKYKGYTESEAYLEVPNPYYIMTQQYCIEMSFVEATSFIGNSIQFCGIDLSSDEKKILDERIEEEKRNQEFYDLMDE
jgi:hypothetical protein